MLKDKSLGEYYTFDPATNATLEHNWFVYSNGQFRLDFPPSLEWLGGPAVTLADINDDGQIIGMRYNGGPQWNGLFLYDDGIFSDIALPPEFAFADVRGMNNKGQLVGAYQKLVRIDPYYGPVYETHGYVATPRLQNSTADSSKRRKAFWLVSRSSAHQARSAEDGRRPAPVINWDVTHRRLLYDGSVHDVDIYAPPPSGEPNEVSVPTAAADIASSELGRLRHPRVPQILPLTPSRTRVLRSRSPCFAYSSCSSVWSYGPDRGGVRAGLFHWEIEGMGSSSRQLLVTITPTLFAVVNSFDPKTTILNIVTADDSDPTTITPEKTEPAPKSGLRATFTRPPRRFTLTVTLADGSTDKVDPPGTKTSGARVERSWSARNWSPS